MGTPATSHGTIAFDSPEQAQTAFKQIKVWVERANSNTLPEEKNGDYNILNLDLNAGERFIDFIAESGRFQNLGWQLQNLLNFCKRLKGIETFEAPIMVLSEDGTIFWNKDDEED